MTLQTIPFANLAGLLFTSLTSVVLPLVLDIDGIWYALVFAETAALVISAVLLAKNRKRYHYV